MFSLWRYSMGKDEETAGLSVKQKSAAGDPKGKDDLDPCEKAFHQETQRLEDADEACDDGVR
jgi:hypothetical protein